MRFDNSTAPARAATAPRAPNHAKARQTLPTPHHPARAKRTHLHAPRNSQSRHLFPNRQFAIANRQSPNPHHRASAKRSHLLPRLSASASPISSLDSPSISRAKPAITPRKPPKNPHFAAARLAPISCPTLNPINPYIHPRPQDANRATFFPATHPQKPPLQKATSCCDFASSERRNKPPVAGDSHHA
jgi:hypothetical protein